MTRGKARSREQKPAGKAFTIADLMTPLVNRDRTIAKRLNDAPDLAARRAIWMEIPLRWREGVRQAFAALGKDSTQRTLLLAQLEVLGE